MQEVVGDDRTALQAVVAADAELMSLREEEAQLTQRLDATHIDEGAAANGAGPSTSGEDADSDRLTAIYERMTVWSLLCSALLDVDATTQHWTAMLAHRAPLGIWHDSKTVNGLVNCRKSKRTQRRLGRPRFCMVWASLR